jgi:hypothetical protein
MHIFYGFLMTSAGALLVAKSEWMLNNFGRIGFFDKYLGTSGGTRLGYKLIGLLVAFFGILIMTDLIGAFVLWILGPLIKNQI